MKGKYIAVESIDGGGKGTILKGFKKTHEDRGESVFDLEEQWLNEDSYFKQWFGTNNILPSYSFVKEKLKKEGIKPTAYIVAEPTFQNIGKFIREVAINKDNHKDFTPYMRINLYAQDREELLSKFITPALEDGKNVYSSRNVTSSLVYQSTELEEGFERIASIPGNDFAMKNLPDHTIISAISIDKSLSNLEKRGKNDDAFFENKDFQTKILEKYLSNELKDLLEEYGSKVHYFDISDNSTSEDTINNSKKLLENLT